MGWQSDYWTECVACAAEECGLAITTEQLSYIAEAVQGGHENYGMASGDWVASSNLHAAREREVSDLRKEVIRGRNKVTCRECNGRGRLQYSAGPWAIDTQCGKCRGHGRHDP